MDSAYVQHASLNKTPNAAHRTSFTNLSSQQRHPGTLQQFHTSQNAAMQPMPFTHNQIPADSQAFGQWMAEGRNNVSSLGTNETMGSFFAANTMSTKHDFRLPSQKAWNVPFSQAEARATDMF